MSPEYAEAFLEAWFLKENLNISSCEFSIIDVKSGGELIHPSGCLNSNGQIIMN
jgi:hypothetical protein